MSIIIVYVCIEILLLLSSADASLLVLRLYLRTNFVDRKTYRLQYQRYQKILFLPSRKNRSEINGVIAIFASEYE